MSHAAGSSSWMTLRTERCSHERRCLPRCVCVEGLDRLRRIATNPKSLGCFPTIDDGDVDLQRVLIKELFDVIQSTLRFFFVRKVTDLGQ
jgi:hypothetical protein